MESSFGEFMLRPATNTDIPSVKEVVFTILKEYHLPYGDTSKDGDLNDIEKSYFGSGGFFGVVVDTTVNNIVATFGLAVYEDKVFELRKMYVHQLYRGKGLGKWMLEQARVFAIGAGYKKIYLETITPLKTAIAMYQEFGFKEVPIKEKSDRVDRAFELNLI